MTLRVVLAERLEVDAEHVPLAGPLQPPRELPLAERGSPLVAAPFDGIVADVHVGTDVLDSLGVEVDARDRLRDLPALATHRIERDVLAVDLVLILREHLANAVKVREDPPSHVVEGAVGVQLRVRDHLDRNLQSVGIGLQQGGEVGGVRVALAERVRNRGVRLPEVPAERARVDLAEPHDLPVGVRQLPRDLAERVLVVGGEHLPDFVAALAQHRRDEVPSHDLVEVAEVCDPPRRRDAALDHDRLVRVARLDLVGDHVSPEGAEPLAVVPSSSSPADPSVSRACSERMCGESSALMRRSTPSQ